MLKHEKTRGERLHKVCWGQIVVCIVGCCRPCFFSLKKSNPTNYIQLVLVPVTIIAFAHCTPHHLLSQYGAGSVSPGAVCLQITVIPKSQMTPASLDFVLSLLLTVS